VTRRLVVPLCNEETCQRTPHSLSHFAASEVSGTGGRFTLPLAAEWEELAGQKAIVARAVSPVCRDEYACGSASGCADNLGSELCAGDRIGCS
jgi:hypothetical protein